MKRFILLLTAFAVLQGCTGVSQKQVDGYKFEEAYSIGLFTPTYQYKRVSKCEVKAVHHKAANSFGSGWTEEVYEKCILIGGSDGFTPDLSGPVGPMILQAGGSVSQGLLIRDGLEDSGDSISNTNQQGQIQGQGQLQGQLQGQSVSGGCRGNCGGGPR